MEVKTQGPTGTAQAQPEGNWRDAKDLGRLWCTQPLKTSQRQGFLVHVGQSLPCPGEVDLTSDHVFGRVVDRVGHGGQPYCKRPLSLDAPAGVEHHAAGDAEQPRTSSIVVLWQVVESPPSNEKCLSDYVFCLGGMDPALREAEQVGIGRVVQARESGLAVVARGLVTHARNLSITPSSVSQLPA